MPQKNFGLAVPIQDPIEGTLRWIKDAWEKLPPPVGEADAVAMVLSTATPDGTPSARVVLFKGMSDEKEFLFFTNYGSRKATEILKNSKASLTFFWPKLERQIRIEGTLKQTSQAISDRYWDTRPKESNISAWASAQSRPIESREWLESQVGLMRERFAETEKPPRPEFWGGFAMDPSYFEFWEGRANRLHVRLAFSKRAGAWTTEMLSP